MNCKCGGRLIVLETRCTEAYQKNPTQQGIGTIPKPALDWYRDVVKRCVCGKCGKEQDVVVDTVKQDRRFK